MIRLFAVFGAVVALSACAVQPLADTSSPAPADNIAVISDRLAARVPDALAEHKVAGVGIAVIEEGKVALTAYYGEQGPGIPASEETVFNTASVAKTLTAETLIALASKDLIDLDAPVASLVENEDLQTDPRFQKLTPRLNMSHRAGLLNWPHVYEDGTASFVAEPGEGFHYSGMAVEMAAEYAEAKLGKDFEDLAFEHVLDPAGITDMSMGRLKPWMTGRLAIPMDREGDYFDLADGDGRLSAEENTMEWSAADDLMTTVEAYAGLIVSLLPEEATIGTAQALRTDILTSLADHEVWGCKLEAPYACANEYGHSIGWMVYKYDDHTVIKHGGNDAGENAIVLYSPETRNGAVILANGGNGVFVTTEIMGLIGHEPDMAAYYRALVGKFFGTKLPVPHQELAD